MSNTSKSNLIISSFKPNGLLITLFIALILFCIPNKTKAQYCNTIGDGKDILSIGLVLEGDTFALIQLETVTIEAQIKFATRKQKEQWDRLKYNVKKAYPYAIIAAGRLREYENILKKMSNESSRKSFMKIAEDKLKKEFEVQLKQLTIKQGRILIKLIDRETGRTSYDLVKQLRGSFSAWMWQGLAKLFGSDLKSEYDAKGEDKLIELAIAQIENGSF